MQIHVVESGESVDSIAVRYRVPSATIIYANQLVYPYRLTIGQALLIQDDTQQNIEKPLLITNGYAYPFISPWVLEETLPYLSELSIFSYGFNTEGELIPPILDDTWMIAAAWGNRTKPILTLTPFGSDGQFNNYLVSVVSNNMEAQQNLIAQLLATVREKGYAGVDIDFEFILAADREAFAEFVSNVTSAMNPEGYQVSVALAPKTSANQPGLLYEGKDYALLGAAANHVLLMTYEWGYTFGPAMAVAPINKVREVVEYAVTEIPVEKINLGIPNYGYDWTLPYERGVSMARTIGNIEAVQIAIANGVPIQFDETAMSPFFNYTQNGVLHEVWFEDVRSLQAKFDLVKEFGLRGVGYWQIMQLFRANWLLLADNFQIVK
ncbi:MAG: LysM peptidoglycan-binding domain-containing protein [Lachnospiraceae bacterium]|nr:LysM peptidoglycan-binding domain-containing protein [Lachnospiraceae bacterium]